MVDRDRPQFIWKTYLYSVPLLFLGAYIIALLGLALLGRAEFTFDFVASVDKIRPLAWYVSFPIFVFLFAGFEIHRRRGVDLHPYAIHLVIGAFLLLAFSASEGRGMFVIALPALAALAGFVVLPHLVRARIHLRAERLLRKRGGPVPYVLWLLVFAWMFSFSYHRFACYVAGGYDLGLFTQTVWLLSRGLAPHNSVMGMHAFGDHAEFADFLAVPLMWLWESPGALLLLQSFTVSLGVIGVFKFARRKTRSALAALIFAALYPLLFGVQAAVMFEWNPETVPIGFVPWLFYYVDSGRWKRAVLMLILIGMCKENLLLFTATFGLFVLFYYRGRMRRAAGAAIFALSLAAFWAEMQFLFPQFIKGGFRHVGDKGAFILGRGYGAIARKVITNPASALLYVISPARKAVRLVYPFSTLMFLPLLFPYAVLLVGPFLATRYFSIHDRTWLAYFYGGIQETLLLLCVVMLIPHIKQKVPRLRIASIAFYVPALAACSLALYLIFTPIQRADLLHYDTFTLHFRPSPAQCAAYEKALAMIPRDASVAAQDNLVPHLSMREHIYIFKESVIGQVDYIVIDRNGKIIPPLTVSSHKAFLKKVLASPDYETRFEEAGVYLFVKK